MALAMLIYMAHFIISKVNVLNTEERSAFKKVQYLKVVKINL